MFWCWSIEVFADWFCVFVVVILLLFAVVLPLLWLLWLLSSLSSLYVVVVVGVVVVIVVIVAVSGCCGSGAWMVILDAIAFDGIAVAVAAVTDCCCSCYYYFWLSFVSPLWDPPPLSYPSFGYLFDNSKPLGNIASLCYVRSYISCVSLPGQEKANLKLN